VKVCVLGNFLLTKHKIRDIIKLGGEDMKPCRFCGGKIFDVIGGFLKVCLKCFSFAKMTKEEMEGNDGNKQL
jgi:hypothetical protein